LADKFFDDAVSTAQVKPWKEAQAGIFLACIQEVLDSSLGRDTGYHG
jgi:hypothetical protein